MSENITNVTDEALNNSQSATDKIWLIAAFLFLLYGVAIVAILRWARQKNIDQEAANHKKNESKYEQLMKPPASVYYSLKN